MIFYQNDDVIALIIERMKNEHNIDVYAAFDPGKNDGYYTVVEEISNISTARGLGTKYYLSINTLSKIGETSVDVLRVEHLNVLKKILKICDDITLYAVVVEDNAFLYTDEELNSDVYKTRISVIKSNERIIL